MTKFVSLTKDETLLYASFSDATREAARGFTAGMETARKIFLEQLIAARTPEPPVPPKEETPNG